MSFWPPNVPKMCPATYRGARRLKGWDSENTKSKPVDGMKAAPPPAHGEITVCALDNTRRRQPREEAQQMQYIALDGAQALHAGLSPSRVLET